MRSAPTKYIVGGLLWACLTAGVWLLVPPAPAIVLTLLLFLEGWALVDPDPTNTISEQIWWMSQLPLVPYLFGAATVAMIAESYIPTSRKGLYTVAAIGLLMGHFFFPKGKG